MPIQPINLLDILDLDGQSGIEPVMPPGFETNIPPPQDTIDLTARQQEKRPLEVVSSPPLHPPNTRQRIKPTSSHRQLRSSSSSPWVPILARPDGSLLTKEDNINSPKNAYAVAQAVMLPVDMEKERGSSYDKLLRTGLQSSIRGMQKMIAGLERARDNKKDFKKEIVVLTKRAEKAEKDNSFHVDLWRDANKENDELKEKLEAVKKQDEEKRAGPSA